MRRFFFLNSIGQQIDLQDKEHYYLNNPAGLGIAMENEYASTAAAFHVPTSKKPAQINITGDLIFPGRLPYTDFKNLVDWMCSGYDLIFGYNPDGGQTYYVDIDVEGLDKTEMRGGFLTCPISILGRSPWYDKNPMVQNMEPAGGENVMAFEFAMESYFPLSVNSNSLDVTPAGHYPAALRIIAQGPMDNPVITIRDTATGAVVCRADMTGLSVPSGALLHYSSIPGETSEGPNTGAWVIAHDGTKTDVTDYFNMEDINFTRLPVGRISTIGLEFSGASELYTVYLYQYRKAV